MYVHANNLINTLIYKSIDYQKATTAAPARHIYIYIYGLINQDVLKI